MCEYCEEKGIWHWEGAELEKLLKWHKLFDGYMSSKEFAKRIDKPSYVVEAKIDEFQKHNSYEPQKYVIYRTEEDCSGLYKVGDYVIFVATTNKEFDDYCPSYKHMMETGRVIDVNDRLIDPYLVAFENGDYIWFNEAEIELSRKYIF